MNVGLLIVVVQKMLKFSGKEGICHENIIDHNADTVIISSMG